MLSNASSSLSLLTPTATLAREQSKGTFRLKGRDRVQFVNGVIAGRTYHVDAVLTSDVDFQTLQSVQDARAVVCYRDHKGNLLFGKIARLNSREGISNRSCTFDVVEVEYDESI
jgi:hypothetical protein